MEELVVLVDEQNHELGTVPKATVHTTQTPLHRGFSLFLFNSRKQLLVTRRALTKKTFPGVWTNTLCGHPGLGESAVEAAKRRLKEELEISQEQLKDIREVAPYQYRFADKNGVVENEICPIVVAHGDIEPHPKPDEVEEWKWMEGQEFLTEIKRRPDIYSPWCRQEVALLLEFF